ncbi:MSP (Major sperm protein) domain-containing protein [Ditylenchus destructor]|uniref:MSP (Major sperm protein) domain-containing protein n=1 Tax=Ditylenchus destructor TaxID=166010 RepID=A0AAD4MKY8_9BILA|nr:MSP (Major sperm protein) domain-containing protein [Ditylenchus destructor]
MSLAVIPPAVEVAASGGVTTHRLFSLSAKRLAFKVKSTNNDHYSVNPVYGFIEPTQSAILEVTRLEGPPTKPPGDRLVIQYLEVGADVTDATELFKRGSPPHVKVALIATKKPPGRRY